MTDDARKAVAEALNKLSASVDFRTFRQRVEAIASMPHPRHQEMDPIDRSRTKTPVTVSQMKTEDDDDHPAVLFRVKYAHLSSDQEDALSKLLDELGLEVVEYDQVGSRWDWKYVLLIGEKGRFFVDNETRRLNPLARNARRTSKNS